MRLSETIAANEANTIGYSAVELSPEYSVALDPRYLRDAATLAYEHIDPRKVFLRVAESDYPVILSARRDSVVGIAVSPKTVRGSTVETPALDETPADD